MNLLKARTEILPLIQKKYWTEMDDLFSAFVLYGGTAVALQLGHRESIDFDFFSSSKISHDWILEHAYFKDSKIQVIQQEPTVLSILASPRSSESTQAVKFSFFWGLTFGLLEPKLVSSENQVQVASLQDLLAHKIKTILQRAEGKDYQDIAAILGSGENLADGLSGASLLFPNFPPQEALKALLFYEDINEAWRIDQRAKEIFKEATLKINSSLPSRQLFSTKI